MTNEQPRLYLATPPLADSRAFAPKLEAALSAGGVTSLLIRIKTEDMVRAARLVRDLAGPAQEKGVAVLVEGPPDLALQAGADGAHISGGEAEVKAAVKQLAPDYIVGAGAGESRDGAMHAGEAGADYLLFGDVKEPLDGLAERVGWWAEIFNTPCVALAQRLEDIAPLTIAGADFIMLEDCVWSDPRGPKEAVEDAMARLAAAGEDLS